MTNFSFNDLILLVLGFLALLRTWQHQNYLLLNENKEPINLRKYYNRDNNFVLNYWKIIPINSKAINSKASTLKLKLNILTYLIYFLIILFIISLVL